MPSVLITGASRGLGLEFARQYAAEGWQVIATCRDLQKCGGLSALKGNFSIEQLDVAESASIDALARRLEKAAIDVLLLNAGVHLQKNGALTELEAGKWIEEMRINAVAPLLVARRFVEHVARSQQRRIVAISSGSGSISNVRQGGNYAYKAVKAALNMSMRVLAADLAPRGITVVPIAPGHTKTDMGGDDAPHSAADSVAKVRATIAALRLEDSGSFFNRDGTRLPW